ncbi:hypothetical protein ACLBWS_16520 [Brucellaceae bacterium D45D]
MNKTIEGLEIVSGKIVQLSTSIAQSDVSNSNIGAMYPFIMMKTANGEVLKINNLVADAHIQQHLTIGRDITLYLKQARHLTNFKKLNFAVAATSSAGTGILDLPARAISGLYSMSVVIGLVGGAIVSFFMTTMIGGIFYYIGDTLAFVTGIYGLENLVFLGAFIGFLCGPVFLIYLLRACGRFAAIRTAAERLRLQLTDSYQGATVRNI